MKLADVFRQLGVAQSHGAWSCSGRNEACNRVVLQLEPRTFRDPDVAEAREGIAKVHEFAYEGHEIAWQFMCDDLAFAHEKSSHVRVIVFNDDYLRWDLLANVGKLVAFDAEERRGKIVLYA